MIALAYDSTGNHLVKIPLRIGDRVQWKRNGQVGAIDAVVREFSISGERVRIYCIDMEEKRWVKPRFLSVHRDGRRLP